MYKIGQVSKMFDLPVSTIRYYDIEGLFPSIKRKSGIRIFSEKEIETIRIINCLKNSGLGLKDIKKFIKWCEDGNSTLKLRKQLFDSQQVIIKEKLDELSKMYSMIRFKCWYYNKAVILGNEQLVANKVPYKLPNNIKNIYDHAHH
ncbi:MerR family transcriptional regulator [Apilactobacillus micheneri]|uniref:MerR family transcriptional regulator n=1 Tax=Apilactobacillus micheneri TaxID=1899430 RepID=A0ABY2Z0B1_9LACO|nr:MerR family transcriptional regulator [Apilactobacillus micheneri]TPR22837.1 MerR family transcriptional regulator [Apilactobacillus micheneri]TPR24409.1 MerR family transcriptional regulator [Apilactobacillus micheneri]TPR27287.1 MerR family transcriptional regulator [Apilactobacillus micheneri]TPR28669.1 MerR family transcriptional regulator [Apilactobacillus micheneri]TPR28729.1 MerR family transcriptional regulator [Apilactobacillus micheneri]